MWLSILRIWVGLYWVWNGIDDRRRANDTVSRLEKCDTSARFSWYRNHFAELLKIHAKMFALLIPITIIVAGLLNVFGILVEVAVIYIMIYCLNLYVIGFISRKNLAVQLIPLLIVGLSGSNQTLSLPWLLPYIQ